MIHSSNAYSPPHLLISYCKRNLHKATSIRSQILQNTSSPLTIGTEVIVLTLAQAWEFYNLYEHEITPLLRAARAR